MSTNAVGARLKAAAPHTSAGVMAAIGFELAQCKNGAQSESEARDHISLLVKTGKALMRHKH